MIAMEIIKLAELIICIIMNLMVIAGWVSALVSDEPTGWNTPTGIVFACFMTAAMAAMLIFTIQDLKKYRK